VIQHEISAQDLASQLKAAPSSQPAAPGVLSEAPPGFVLLDVREPWEVDMGAIAGSRNMPMGDVPTRAHQELDPDAHIVVYCHRGVRSLSVVLWLREQGFERAQSLAGGIDGWSIQIDPSIDRY
jgi:rhodanese-related sulfurtransferase